MVREIGLALRPLEDALASPEACASLMARLGWNVESLAGPFVDLLAPARRLAAALDAMEGGEPSPSTIVAAAESLAGLVERIRAIALATDAAFDAHLVADDFK